MRLLLLLAFAAVSVPFASAQITASGPYNASDPPLVSQYDLAQATTFRDPETHDLSGSTANAWTRWVAASGNWIYRIEMGERNDRPCQLTLYWAGIHYGSLRFGSHDVIQCSPSSSSIERVGFRAVAPAGGDADRDLGAIRGFRVCQRSQNGRVKGLEIRGTSVTNLIPRWVGLGGTPVSEGTRFERSNCNDWESDFAMCPPGEVMVGVYARHQGTPPTAAIKGMAPVCARLGVRR